MNSSQEEQVDTETTMPERAAADFGAVRDLKAKAAMFMELFRAIVERWPPTWALDTTNPAGMVDGLIRSGSEPARAVAVDMLAEVEGSTGWVPATFVKEWAHRIFDGAEPPRRPTVVIYPPDGTWTDTPPEEWMIEVWTDGEVNVVFSSDEGDQAALAETTDMDASAPEWRETVERLIREAAGELS